ncbi:hypothetical protein EV360DRAFT_88448 [Lentinula raphanica]|nr:hypothetical protein EV360DRAFT_88448 [Lentinula raphanica]
MRRPSSSESDSGRRNRGYSSLKHKTDFEKRVPRLGFTPVVRGFEALYRIRNDSRPISLVSLMTSPPNFTNTVSILFKSSMRASILAFFLLAVITQAVAISSIFIPGTLTVTQSAPTTDSLEIPTIDFNLVDPVSSSFVTVDFQKPPTLGFLGPSQSWQQLMINAASSNVAPTWYAPAGCGSSCTYTFTYSAPALNCTEPEFHGFLPIGHSADGPYAGTNTTYMTLSFRCIAQTFSQILEGNAFYQTNSSGLVTDSNAKASVDIVVPGYGAHRGPGCEVVCSRGVPEEPSQEDAWVLSTAISTVPIEHVDFDKTVESGDEEHSDEYDPRARYARGSDDEHGMDDEHHRAPTYLPNFYAATTDVATPLPTLPPCNVSIPPQSNLSSALPLPRSSS